MSEERIPVEQEEANFPALTAEELDVISGGVQEQIQKDFHLEERRK